MNKLATMGGNGETMAIPTDAVINAILRYEVVCI